MNQITETQLNGTIRIYNIDGPKWESVVSFWDYLVQQEIIESYTIYRGHRSADA